MAIVMGWQAGSGVKSQPSRCAADVRHGRKNVGRELYRREFVESLFLPGAEARKLLPARVPATVKALHHEQQPRLDVRLAAILGGPEIAQLVESQILWVAQPTGDDFEVGAIPIQRKIEPASGEAKVRPGVATVKPRSPMLK